MTVRLVCWNIDKQSEPWQQLAAMDGVDAALLQEAGNVPSDLTDRFECGPIAHFDSHVWNAKWWTTDRFRRLYDRWARVVGVSDRVDLEWFKQVSPISEVAADEIAVSGIGTIAAARVTPCDAMIEPFIAVSAYARWLSPHPSAVSDFKVGYPDASAHRIISDLSAFIGSMNPAKHRVIVAGDFNMANDDNAPDQAFLLRERTVWARLEALGLEYIGPNSGPTYRTRRESPRDATVQLDHVFASRGFHEQIKVRAINSPEQWGPSDHCRILIEVG